MSSQTCERAPLEALTDAPTVRRTLPHPVASAWRTAVEQGIHGPAPATGDSLAVLRHRVEELARTGPRPTAWDRVADYALIGAAALSALTVIAFLVARVSVQAELALIGIAALLLAGGHLLLRSRRKRRAAEHDAWRARRELELCTLVARGEAREHRLSAFSEVAAQIAHEVRNPLSSIVLNSELLKDEIHACAHASPEARRLATAVCTEAERLNELTNEFLAFARLPHLSTSPQPLRPLVEELAHFSRTSAAQAGITLTVEGQDPGEALLDARLIRQALLNLLRNGMDAAGPGGRVTLRTGRAAGRVFVDVLDSGPGVPPHLHEAIFEPFVSTKAHGTGLGLAVARKVARDHGGELTLLDLAQGAWFRLELPVSVGNGAAPAS
jgi:signal transduction histidine kinase